VVMVYIATWFTSIATAFDTFLWLARLFSADGISFGFVFNIWIRVPSQEHLYQYTFHADTISQ